MVIGQLESKTTEDILEGANLGAFIKSNGEVEIIQFETAVLVSDNIYNISGLLRGRRGTEVFGYNYQGFTRFILLENVKAVNYTLEEVDAGIYLKGTSVGTYYPVDSFLVIFKARNLFPYAPVHIRAARFSAGTNNGVIGIDWVRRTKYGGAFRGGTGVVPISETSELYDILIPNPDPILYAIDNGPHLDPTPFPDIEVLDSSGGSGLWLRIAAIGSPPFPSGHWLENPTEITLTIYQKSELIGRGFGREITIPVKDLGDMDVTNTSEFQTIFA